MKTTAMPGMAATIAFGGCAAETGWEEQSGEVDDGLTTYPDVLFSSAYTARIKPPDSFHVPENGSIDLTLAPRWSQKDPAHPCHVKTVLLLANKLPPKPDGIGVKSVPTSGGPYHVSWSGLASGNYVIDLDTNNELAGCVLASKITVVIAP